MTKNKIVVGLSITMIIALALSGCKNDKKQKALAEEAAHARAEVVKLKAETVQLKSEISYLNEKLVAANQARDKIQIQLDLLIQDNNATTTDADNFQEENDKLRKLLAEQLKKTNEMGRQIETLKIVIREIQARIEPNKISELPPQPIEETPTGK
jgi:chromosome segregation ATPase